MVDVAATEQRRAPIRAQRLADLQNNGGDYTARDLPVLHRWGDILQLVRDGDTILVQVTGRGAILCLAAARHARSVGTGETSRRGA